MNLYAVGLLLCGFSSVVSAVLLPQQCHQNGEYCQTHWDCCSGTCLTYLYKCTRSHQFINPYRPGPSIFLPPSVPASNGPTISLDDLIESLFPGGRRTKPVQNGISYEVASRFDDDERTTSNDNVLPEADTTTTTTSPSTVGSVECKSIGEKCYKNDDCCTNRCHGFLHQCVT